MSSKRIVRCVLAVLALALAIVTPGAEVPAQAPPDLPPPGAYQSIPNFTGVGAGALFRQAINQRFSGAQPVSPTITNVTFANLPTEQNGMMIFCSDCKLTTPCSASGAGACGPLLLSGYGPFLPSGYGRLWPVVRRYRDPPSELQRSVLSAFAAPGRPHRSLRPPALP